MPSKAPVVICRSAKNPTDSTNTAPTIGRHIRNTRFT
jgi:hypothetical protein